MGKASPSGSAMSKSCGNRSTRVIGRAISRFFEKFSSSAEPVRLPFAPEALESRTMLAIQTFPVIADTFVQAGSPNSNFGTSTRTCDQPLPGLSNGCLAVINDNGTNDGGLSRIAYLKFNLTGITGNVNSATLRLVGVVSDPGSETRIDDVYGVADTTWIESGAGSMTYNTRPALGALVSSQTITPTLRTTSPFTWDVFNWVQQNPNQMISLAVQMQAQGSQRHFFRSKEYSVAADRPVLIMSVGVPTAPAGLTATPANGSVTLNWGATDATSYSVYRGTASGSLSLLQAGITDTNYIDGTVTNGTQYFYHIVATNNSGDSAPSNEVSVTPVVERVAGPTPVATAAIGSISLTWEPVQFADTYNIYRSTTPNVVIEPGNLIQAAATSPFTDSNVQVGTIYYYRITSVNAAGEGLPGGEVSSSPGVVGTGTGISAVIYDNMDFTGPSVSRVDPTINFDFGLGTPDSSIVEDTFSIRWTGYLQAQFTEAYTLHTISDDGIRVWINDQLVLNSWVDQAPTEHASIPINLVAGEKYHIRVDFYENLGGAVAQLLWSSHSTPEVVVPSTQLHPDDGVARKPVAPIDPIANAVDSNTVCVLWSDAAINETGFVLQRATNPNFTDAVNISLAAGPNVTSCRDTGVTAGGNFYYRVLALNDLGESSFTIANQFTLSNLVRANNVSTATTPGAHGLAVGGTVTISGATPSSFNGTFTIAAVPTPTTFTFSNPGVNETVFLAGTYLVPVVPSGTPGPVNFPSFPDMNPDLVLVDGGDPNTPPPRFTNGRLRLTDPINGSAGAAWTKNVKFIDSFTSSFDFQFTQSDGADGMVFVIQAAGGNVIGGAGGGLGFAGMPRSVGIKLDFYPNLNQTGVYINGIMNDTLGNQLNQSTDIGGFGFDFDNGAVYHVDIAYDGETIVYTVSTLDRTRTASLHYTIDIAAIIGSDCAFIGFTAANGGLHATHEILNWNFTDGAPIVNGTIGNDTFYVRVDQPGGNRVHVWKNRDPASNPIPDIDVARSAVTNLAISGGRGNDTFTIDLANGNPIPAAGLLVDGGQQLDTLIVKGTAAGESITADGALINLPVGSFRHLHFDIANFNLGENGVGDPDDSVTVTGPVTFTPVLNGGGGNNTLTLPSGTYTYTADALAGNNDGAGNSTLNVVAGGNATVNFNARQHLKSLALNDTAKAVFSAGGSKFLRTGALNIASAAALDVGDGDVIVQSTAGNKMADWQRLLGYVVSGRSGGLWNGPGIRSASAANLPTRATSVGIILNDAGGGVPILSTFNGESVNANTILLKYTYYGDRDFDGDIDADDYAAIDASWANRNDPNNLVFPRQPIRHGDTDLSGVIDSDDYFWIDKAYSNQTTVLSNEPAPVAAASSTTSATSTSKNKAAKKAKAKKAAHHRAKAVLFRVRD